jgi:hypothetical protein
MDRAAHLLLVARSLRTAALRASSGAPL